MTPNGVSDERFVCCSEDKNARQDPVVDGGAVCRRSASDASLFVCWLCLPVPRIDAPTRSFNVSFRCTHGV